MRVNRLVAGGVAVLFLSCVVVGCGGPGGGTDGGGTPGQSDGGGVTGGGTTDGGNGGGTTTDAGSGGGQDGGTVADGGNPTDGGTLTDGGTPSDGGTGVCSGTPCSIVAPQCGCASGQACYPNGSTNVCTTAGTVGEGQTCSTMPDCAAGLGCLNIAQGGTPLQECTRFCTSDADCTGGPGSVCAHTVKDQSGNTLFQVCSVSCDPIGQTGCPSGTDCIIAQEPTGAKELLTDCATPVGTATQGQSCSSPTDCAPGFGCIGSPAKCLRYCTAPGQKAAGGCASTETCFGLNPALVIGSTQYGVCDTSP